MPDALCGSCFFMRLSSRIWCDTFLRLRDIQHHTVFSSVLFCFLFFFSIILVDLPCCFFSRSFVHSVASNFVIKRFSSVVFFAGHQHFATKSVREYCGLCNEHFYLLQMSNILHAVWFCSFHSRSAVSIVRLSRHIQWHNTNYERRREEKKNVYALVTASYLILLTLIWFISSNLHFFFSTKLHTLSHPASWLDVVMSCAIDRNMLTFFMLCPSIF